MTPPTARSTPCLISIRWAAELRPCSRRVALCGSWSREAQATARFLRSVPFIQVHSSTLRRCQQTARPIAEANIGRPDVVFSNLLEETALGVIEGELKGQQSTVVMPQLLLGDRRRASV
jgi:phosphohistidine phosphatase SixA